jgi:hypothetical protein
MKERHVMPFIVLLVVLLFLGCTFAHAQYSSISPLNGPSYQPPSNPRHADQHDLAPMQNLLGNNSISEGHGERPLWEFGGTPEVSLGDFAKKYRAEHAKLAPEDRAQIRWNKQGQ